MGTWPFWPPESLCLFLCCKFGTACCWLVLVFLHNRCSRDYKDVPGDSGSLIAYFRRCLVGRTS